MSKQLSEPANGPVDPVLQRHFEECSNCRGEYERLAQILGFLAEIPRENIQPSEEAWEALEKRVAATKQAVPEDRLWKDFRFDFHWIPKLSPRGILIVQYVYIVCLGIGVWLSLAFGQPLFLGFTQEYGFQSPGWLIEEFGIFLLFLLLGSFTAVIAAPILIPQGFSKGGGNVFFKKLFGLFCDLRLFAW